MAQYGGDQRYKQEVRQTDEYGNPIQKLEEHETIVHSDDTGGQYQRQVRKTEEHGETIVRKTGTGGTMGEYGSLGQANQGLSTNIGHAAGGTRAGNISGGRSTGQTGHQGLGYYGATGQHQQGLGQGNRGAGTGTGHQGVGKDIGHDSGGDTPGGRSIGQTGYQGLGTQSGAQGGTMGDHGSTGQQQHRQGLGQGHQGTGTGTIGSAGRQGMGDGRSVGQTGYQGLGTEPPTESYQNQADAAPISDIGIGTRTRASGDKHERKGTAEKIKEKLPGHHD